MTTPNVRALLAGHPFLDGVSPQYLDLIANAASEAMYEPRELIFHEGDEASEFHVICRGKVAIEIFTPDRGPVAIETINTGEVLGWSWLIEPYRWLFDAQAIEPTEVIAIDARKIRESMAADSALSNELLRRFVPIIVGRLQATRMQLLDLYHVDN
jgi:CRP-like cAMP-binding protein